MGFFQTAHPLLLPLLGTLNASKLPASSAAAAASAVAVVSGTVGDPLIEGVKVEGESISAMLAKLDKVLHWIGLVFIGLDWIGLIWG